MYRITEIASNVAPTQATQGIVQTIRDISLTEADKDVVRVIIKNPRITQKEIALEIGWKVDRVKYYINKLKQQNVIQRVGSSQKGHWNLLIEKDWAEHS